MKALVMMLFNIKESTYHPILYFEHPFSGGDREVTRYRSKGHRTVGFKNRGDAVNTIQPELVDRLEGYNVELEIETDLPWDGMDVPADNQLR